MIQDRCAFCLHVAYTGVHKVLHQGKGRIFERVIRGSTIEKMVIATIMASVY